MINKVTSLRSSEPLTDQIVQDHLDLLNSQGWNLIAVDNLVGWYRFFWAKEET